MQECGCDFRTRMVGDGCKICNPKLYIRHLEESVEDHRRELNEIYNLLGVDCIEDAAEEIGRLHLIAIKK